MEWPVALVLMTFAVALVTMTWLSLRSLAQENRRLMRALFARREYPLLEARDTGIELDDGVPPGMM